jgi:two-component sensor histidine kinase
MDKNVRRFYKISALSLLAATLLVMLLFYIPLEESRQKAAEERFHNALALRALSVDFTISSLVSGVRALTSRSVIRDALADYSPGKIDFENLKAFTEPKYRDGVGVLKHLEGVGRFLPDGKVLTLYGKEELILPKEPLTSRVELETGEKRLFLKVTEPIIKGDQLLGYDRALFDISFALENPPPEVLQFSLLTHSGEEISVPLDSWPFYLSGSMNHAFFDEVNRRSLPALLLYATLLFLLIGLLFYGTQYRFMMGLMNRLTAQLESRELLIREMQHRIKNNMNGVVAFLTIQEAQSEEEAVRHALRSAAGRVESISTLYDQMLKAQDFQEFPLGDYLQTITERILQLLSSEAEIEVSYDFEEIHLDGNYLFPLGLITNELVTNALKYAFKGRQSGVIQLSAHREKSRIILVIEDDGIGMAAAVDPDKAEGFGTRLVKMLVEQLEGELHYGEGPGTRIRIEFYK